MEPRKTKICLGWPWYAGPDEDTYALYMAMCHYFGKLQDRSEWLQHNDDSAIPNLDTNGDPAFEITKEDGIFEFCYSSRGGLSLPGLAREMIADDGLQMGCDWVFMWDDDMLLPWNAFLRLWRHQKPVCAALAFTSREPIQPVIYRIKQEMAGKTAAGTPVINYRSETVFDYPKNKLITDTDVGGPLAFGAGVVLIKMDVFRQLSKPWFHSTGCGEDWMFCVRCYEQGISRYVDTSLKTKHKAKKVIWYGEEEYEQMQKDRPLDYERLKAV